MGTIAEKMTGAVLVQGAGIAGVQASLDLANSGFKVYLVERSPAIGGMMSHLDKTFPTGDCATCIVSPKLVECARNLNVEILTLSDLENLTGEPGNFHATVRRHPGYVLTDKCTACGDCTTACPVYIPDRFDRGLGTRKAVAKHYAQAVPNVCTIQKLGHAPCKINCPAHINVQGYVQLIKKKEYLKAVNLIRERNPLSAICGRVCTHPCEEVCTRANADSSLAIRQLKRFASDKEMEMIESGELALPDERTPAPDAKKIAVIGGGPAGLTAASDLAEMGFAVTVYESHQEAGGMLRWGIPEYRLPKNVLGHEIELIRRKGVNFIYNCNIGKDIMLNEIREKSDAVFVSSGVQNSRKLGVEGEDLTGVSHGIEFLRSSAKDAESVSVKGKVVVIGGGNVAVDVARTALRLGADSVEMVCLERLKEMPAYDEEVEATLHEGIAIRDGWGPVKITGNGSVSSIEFKRCTRVFDEDGRFSPAFDESDTCSIETGQVIIAIGQAIDDRFLQDTGTDARELLSHIDPVTLETSIEGLFAGGDAVSGPASVIDAVAAGKRAAESISKFLNNEDLRANRFEDTLRPVPEELLPVIDTVETAPRAVHTELAVEKRLGNFLEVESTFTEEDALAEAERCLNCALCSECGECFLACEQKAIDYDMTETTVDIEVGSVILAPGFEEFQAELKGEYGYGRYSNVVTSVQFERMLSAAGPFEGHVVRLSDGKPAKRIAFIQCVGSRDSTCDSEYCSSICCMAATKQAMIAKEHQVGLDATVFYMDIRAHGKDFDLYYERAKNENGVRYVRNIPSRIVQVPGTNDMRLRFLDEKGGFEESEYDLVILSIGMKPGKSVKEYGARIGIDLNEYGFCATDRRTPLSTSRPGVYVAGAFQEPKDIPETVTQASGAASMAMELLAGARNTLITKKEYPDERDIKDDEVRIGVFVCHCGMNIASVVDVEHVAEVVSKLPNVVFSNHTMYTCSDTTLLEIRETIDEHKLNRVVVASCTPRTHEPLFRETLREAGLNPYLFELANIRDQNSWVHAKEPEAATEKAIDLVRMSVARARLLSPLEGSFLTVNQAATIVGGGLSGMTAALSLADQGFKVHLLEREEQLGGNLKNFYFTIESLDVGDFTVDLIHKVESHPNITCCFGAEVDSVAGHIGHFQVKVTSDGTQQEITSGVIIVATGGLKSETTEYLHGQSKNVMKQSDLEKSLYEGTFSADGSNIVMIQCVGSRNEEHAYCSRICCSKAVKNALKIKETSPDANIYVLYRDIRTYGFREKYYKKAREAGVVFIRYDENAPPVVTEDDAGGLVVTLDSPDFPEAIEFETDHLILSTGIEAPADNEKLSNMLKVPLNENGFYLEAHMKLRPVDFATEGIFLCGLAHSPKTMDENIAQAKAAAARAATILSKTQLDVDAQVSNVDQNKCISCLTCVHSCPYTAPFVNEDQKAQIEAAKCMGCGICASECPARAIQLRHFETGIFETMIEELFAEKL